MRPAGSHLHPKAPQNAGSRQRGFQAPGLLPGPGVRHSSNKHLRASYVPGMELSAPSSGQPHLVGAPRGDSSHLCVNAHQGWGLRAPVLTSFLPLALELWSGVHTLLWVRKGPWSLWIGEKVTMPGSLDLESSSVKRQMLLWPSQDKLTIPSSQPLPPSGGRGNGAGVHFPAMFPEPLLPPFGSSTGTRLRRQEVKSGDSLGRKQQFHWASQGE